MPAPPIRRAPVVVRDRFSAHRWALLRRARPVGRSAPWKVVEPGGIEPLSQDFSINFHGVSESLIGQTQYAHKSAFISMHRTTSVEALPKALKPAKCGLQMKEWVWRWRGSNPRPQAFSVRFYMRSRLIWISLLLSRSGTLLETPAPLSLISAQGARALTSQCE